MKIAKRTLIILTIVGLIVSILLLSIDIHIGNFILHPGYIMLGLFIAIAFWMAFDLFDSNGTIHKDGGIR